MRSAYRILADVIAVAVVIQSMAMVWAIAGLFHWIDSGGGSLDSSILDDWQDNPPDFQGAIGFAIHGIVGGMVIPVIALALLIIAFFARVPGGVKWAAILVVLVIVQLVAGYGGYDAAWLGLIHGLNAFALFSLAIVAARAAHPVAETDAQTAMTATP
jgi:heme A synthase